MSKFVVTSVLACLGLAIFVAPSYAQQEKMTASVKKDGKNYSLKIARWEDGAIIIKDGNNQEKRISARYPVLADNVVIKGDPSLCYQVCRDQCGPTACWPVCWYHCTSQGGPGDPRKP